jgi:hypothetical protein|tara:strand:- start:175 stop:552 length:378 start_codon:yes stop_codon:yes gene_type:complete
MRHEKDEYYFEDEADEDRLRQEILTSLRWAIRSLELGGTVDDTMTGMIFRLETGEEWSKSPVIETRPSMDSCHSCGMLFADSLSVDTMIEIEEAQSKNNAIYPSRVCFECYEAMDVRTPYKASMN